jgi:formate dehydrogenase maturation protein FdhE
MNQAGVMCPFCGSDDSELVSHWGGQMITRQMRCRACNTYFEAIREEFVAPPDEPEATPPGTTSSARDR